MLVGGGGWMLLVAGGACWRACSHSHSERPLEQSEAGRRIAWKVLALLDRTKLKWQG